MPATPPPIRIAVDIGGTFTDIEVYDSRKRQAFAHKTPSTPDDPSRGLGIGLKEAADLFGFALTDIGLLLHGTTIATNAVLERKLPKGAMLTTAGFEDVLEIGRHMRKSLYGLVAEPRSLLIPRHLRFGVAERIRFDGTVETALNLDAVRELARKLVDDGVEALAVGFLNAYANPSHEASALAAIRDAAPDLAVSASHEASPEIREFERFSTTALNALLKPVVSKYLEQVEGRLAEIGVAAPLYLVQSNGGVAKPEEAARLPAKLLLSGPAGGAMAMAALAARHGMQNLVGIDMGGTSADIAVVADGDIGQTPEGEIDGLPVRLPMIEIRTIGAGGGSIARVESGGLRVGPESAGAAPGPVCSSRGGARPAVTDANVALARIDAAGFLGGAMPLDDASARAAIHTHVGDPLALSPEAAASGILEVADARMADAIRLSLFEKGADPTDFALAPFGGAGGLHAAALADALDIQTILFPTNASTLSARGILSADLRHDLARSQRLRANTGGEEEAVAALHTLAGELRQDAEASLARDGVDPADREYRLSADMRYRGQAYELVIPWGDVTPDSQSLAELVSRFHREHARRFAHSDEADVVEIATLRMAAIGCMPDPDLAATARAASDPPTPTGHRRVWLSDAWTEAPIYVRDDSKKPSRL
ncbi:MAG: hydantoinase/oxoprolinase family protein [Alphaproteobacteria bacterium]